MATLVTRSAVAAAEGAGVNGPLSAAVVGEQALASLIVTLTGTPTTYEVRAVIEGSPDGGTTWHELVRFKDITNAVTGNRLVRLPGVTAAATADMATDDLSSAEATGTQVDTPWPRNLRAKTRLVSLSGGTTPTATITVRVE